MKKETVTQNQIPIAIVIAGALISLAVFFSGSDGVPVSDGVFGNNLSASAKTIEPVSEKDHIRGDQTAGVSIVEYSDYECPFCARLHPTLSRIVEEFDGDVKWVYRHFPLTSIHSKAFGASVSSECVASIGGDDAFWTFTDRAFSDQRSLGSSLYESIVSGLGLSQEAYQQCITQGDFASVVEGQYQDALDAGGRGTPFVVVINEKGEVFPFSGALPYEQIRNIVIQAIGV